MSQFVTNVLKALYFQGVESKRFQHGVSTWRVQPDNISVRSPIVCHNVAQARDLLDEEEYDESDSPDDSKKRTRPR